MARLPIYEQKTVASSPRATGTEFGANVAQAAVQSAADTMDIGLAMKRREDVLDRVRLLNDFDLTAQKNLNAVVTSQDITSPAAISTYTQSMRQKMNELVGQHTGSGTSKYELQAQLENQLGQYEKSALATQVKAQHEMMGTMIDKMSNELAIVAAFAPDQMDNVFADYDARLDMYKDGMSPQMYQGFRDAGRAKIATNSIARLLTTGQWQIAEQIMKNPNVNKYLSTDTARKFTMDIAVDQGKLLAEQRRQDANVRRWSSVLRRGLTPEEVTRVRALPEKKDMTPADEIVELELVQGRPASADQITQIMNLKANSGGAYGDSLQGRSLNFVTQNADRFQLGMLNRSEAQQFMAMYNEAYKPIEKQDPVTGQWTRIQPAIPPFIQQAMARGSAFYNRMPTGGAPAAPMAPAAPAAPAPAPMSMGSAAPAPMGEIAPAPAAPAPQQQMADRSIWQRRSNVTGPVSAAVNIAGRVPVVGEKMGGGGQITTDRQYTEAQSRELIRALSQSGRYMATEMAAIEKEVDISGSVFDNPESYARRLIGIDEALAKRVQAETKILANPRTPLEQRKAAESVINVINNFRQTLGVPQRVKTPEEARKLPPGTEFIDPAGKVRKVPGGQ